MPRKTQHFVQSLAKGFKVLQAFRQDRPTLTLTQIAEIAGMNTPTAQRITDTLLDLGYLKRNQRKEFFLGPKILTLGFAFLHGSQLTNMAAQYLDDFFDRFHWTVNLSVLEGDEVIYLARREQQRFLKYDVQPGLRLPFNCTAMGKVLAAGLPRAEFRRLMETGNFIRMTPNTIIDPDRFEQEMKEVRRKGYAFCDRELSMDVSAISVPVLDHKEEVVAAANVALPAEAAKGELLAEATSRLMELGRDLSTSLGYVGEYPLIRPPLPEDAPV
jgi:IclR family pca regulon transcriptional regulator